MQRKDPMGDTPHFQPPGSGANCSTSRSARLRQRRFEMGYKVAGYSARFVDLTDEEKNEIIARMSQRLSA